MNHIPDPHDETAPPLFERLEKMEPYVAIRLLILQIGIALCVGWTASRQLEEIVTPVLKLGNPGTLFDLDRVSDFGYPVRELIWSGEWWRIPLGLFLPPQWMLWGIACIGMFPFARFLERRIGRGGATVVYLLGAVTVLYLDLLGYQGVTCGALGMVMAAGGACWTLLRFEGAPVFDPSGEIPPIAWIILGITIPVAWVHSLLHIIADPLTATLTPLVPSWIALLAAAVTGMVSILPNMSKELVESEPDYQSERPLRPPLKRGLCMGIVGLWTGSILGFGLFSWGGDFRIDYLLWKLEPGLKTSDNDSVQDLERLVEKHPQNRFLQKRLAVQHLRNQQWQEGKEILESLLAEPQEKDAKALFLEGLRSHGRLAGLNLRGRGKRGPWRFSGISSNYGTSRPRLLQDLAHVARFAGEKSELITRREQWINEYRLQLQTNLAPPQDSKTEEPTPNPEPEGSEETRKQKLIRAQLLNGVAYARSELEGDLEMAYQEVLQALEILPDSQILDTLGWVEVQRGNFEEGVKALEQALFSPGQTPSGTIYYHLGVANAELGKREKAKGLFEEALRLDLEWWEEIDLFDRCGVCSDPMIP